MNLDGFDFSVITQLVLIVVIIRQAYKIKIFFTKLATEFVKSIVDSGNENFNKIFEQHDDKMDQVITSMEMYTEEVVAIHENHRELKEDHKELKKDVGNLGIKVDKNHKSLLDKIKDNC